MQNRLEIQNKLPIQSNVLASQKTLQELPVLGIDVGTAIVGFGIVIKDSKQNKIKCLDYGTITTPSTLPMPERLQIIFDELNNLLKLYTFRAAAVESLFFANNQKTVMTVSQARGVILLALQLNNVAISEYTPLQVKQGVTGYGKAEKSQVQNMVKAILGLDKLPKPDDAADALAIAITHINHL